MILDEKISIIIPVYKVEQYLKKCLDSIEEQTYTNLEVILVDDGSPDKCGNICDEYAAKDARFQVIHKENAGVARARNDGIMKATGDYISFIDSDDWIAKDAYEKMYKALKENDADCAVGGCVTVIEKDGRLLPQKRKNIFVGTETTQQAMKRVLLNGSAIWNRLFKREIFDEIRFPLDRINDDEVVALHAYAECKKIVFIGDDTYYYRIRANSITTSAFSIKKMDVYYNSIDNLNFVKERIPTLTECAEFKFLKAMLYCYVNMKKISSEPGAKKILERLKNDIRNNKSTAIKNKYMPLSYKALMLIYSL